MPEYRVDFTDAENIAVAKAAKDAGLTKKTYIEAAALYPHIAPQPSPELLAELRNLYELCILFNGKTSDEDTGRLLFDIRGLIRKIEREYFSNY